MTALTIVGTETPRPTIISTSRVHHKGLACSAGFPRYPRPAYVFTALPGLQRRAAHPTSLGSKCVRPLVVEPVACQWSLALHGRARVNNKLTFVKTLAFTSRSTTFDYLAAILENLQDQQSSLGKSVVRYRVARLRLDPSHLETLRPLSPPAPAGEHHE
jgi:hypothetical protein